MWTVAPARALRMAWGSLERDSFSFCHVQKCVHMGEPMSTYGFCSLSMLRARRRLCSREKSHGSPSYGSSTVMSKAKPGNKCFGLISLINLVTRGGE